MNAMNTVLNDDQHPRVVRGLRPGAIAAGVILLLTGAAMLLDTTGVAHVNAGRLVGPIILITMGAAMVLDKGRFAGSCAASSEWRDRRGGRRGRGAASGGIWLIGIGLWMLVSQMHIFGLAFSTSWPLLLVFVGLIMIVRGVR
jgi:hypothetical protein